MRTLVAKLRGKLGEDARNPTYILTASRVGYWMPEGEGGLTGVCKNEVIATNRPATSGLRPMPE